MALISIIQDFKPLDDPRLLARAAELTPALIRTERRPVGAFFPDAAGDAPSPAELSGLSLGRGESVCLDFGRHVTGRVTLSFDAVGSHPDAPAFVRLFFAETRQELAEDPRSYDGWLSRSWIQEEHVHLDELPGILALPRRYAFRYLRITVLDTSPKYRLTLREAVCVCESSADEEALSLRPLPDAELGRLRDASLRTLAECMQTVFEDGPKRDRRLWTGDLRLQALTNSVSFRRFDLVKRCLYLLAGSRFPDGRVSACLFTRPAPAADDTYLFDYALMYPVVLEEYLEQTMDEEALKDLYDAAMAQIDHAMGRLDAGGLPDAGAAKDCFVDWSDDLDRSGCAAAVLIYALGYAEKLARRKEDASRADTLSFIRESLRRRAMERFWDAERGLFVSNGQIAAATQVWMVLAGVPESGEARRIMEKTAALRDGPAMTTPYMHHYYIMALLRAGMAAEAEAHLRRYWGGMLDAGADTFGECWDPDDPRRSPYGGCIVNSACHAWSCTPAYIIERFLRPDPDRTASD